MICFGGNVQFLLIFFSLKECFSMKNVKNVTMSSGKVAPYELLRAVDGDNFTYVQSEGTNISLSIILEKKINISCFYMIVRGGKYDVYISDDVVALGRLCRSFHIQREMLKPHSVRFCCNEDMDGEKVTVMKTDNRPLRLFEIDMNDCSQHKQNMHDCSNCKGFCSDCLQIDTDCISCVDNPAAVGCGKHCSWQCVPGACGLNGTCSECYRGYHGPKCDPCAADKYGINCEQFCNHGCRYKCDKETGVCQACENGFYSPPTCSNSCSANCKSCENSTHCEHCQKGRYGNICQQICPDHCDVCINSTLCVHCEAGYFGALCNSKCPDHCVSCVNESFCDVCLSQWGGPLCRCSEFCDGECSDQGECFGNCSAGWFGSNCHHQCSPHCKHCLESADNCTECHHGEPPHCSDVKLYISEETMTMMMASSGGIILLVLIAICIIIVIRKLCSNSTRDTYGIIDDQNIELEPMHQPNPYSDLECPQYINDSHRVSVDEFILTVHHKKLNNSFQREFKKIPYHMTESCSAALDPKNKSRNRYKKVYPYDASRVVLDTFNCPGSTDYINACFVHGFERQRAYIAAQGPFTEDTVIDFWRMVWQMKTAKIVMLTNVTENGQMKCVKYWPSNEASIGPFLIKTERHNTYRRYTIRHIKLKMGIEERDVTQFQYTAWYTTNVPTNIDSVLLFRNLIMSDISNDSGPLVVHCSAGVGRTGTFIALDYLLQEGLVTGSVDVIGYIKTLRQQRPYAVQSTDEYIFLHDALVEGLSSVHENRTIEIADEF
ncbi:uncharacterized protein LOC125668708 isoform X2 [Ostrea edulis]|uniref:uncharacterized protein LOC125668708 isoform X2 n=1 Tax=Ostrea edulis TaxID=37623 RepID=UPI0024AFDBB8|nr:uncharacterized protein LOC125668708 isoform X2 [Ostrea edulis]